MKELGEYRRDGKHTIRPGDEVKIATADLHVGGVTKTDRGWTGKVTRFLESARYGVAAEVTRPDAAGLRVVDANRLTRKRKVGR